MIQNGIMEEEPYSEPNLNSDFGIRSAEFLAKERV
jgi:hypothetical protein